MSPLKYFYKIWYNLHCKNSGYVVINLTTHNEVKGMDPLGNVEGVDRRGGFGGRLEACSEIIAHV